MIVATDKNRVIGRENKIPWRLRDDLIALSRLTKGHAVILGRKTYESMLWYYNRSGKPMPGKMYIVVTRDTTYKPGRDNATTAHSIEEAIAAAKTYEGDIYVNGGGTIYRELLPFARRIYLTEVNTETEGDAFFPELNATEWREVSREHHEQDERNEFDYDVIVLEKA